MRRSVAYPSPPWRPSRRRCSSPSPHRRTATSPHRRGRALCATGAVPDCGPIKFEPQSVEGPKGLKSCDGGLSQFSVLSDEPRLVSMESVGTTVPFRWVFTARHRTSNWEYFVDGTKVATVDGGNQQPDAVVTHNIDLSKFQG